METSKIGFRSPFFTKAVMLNQLRWIQIFNQICPISFRSKDSFFVNGSGLVSPIFWQDFQETNIKYGPKSNVNFKLNWRPIKPDSYKFTIIFEVIDSRLKFSVDAFGTRNGPPIEAIP
jgi:hypothetical protein